MITFVVYGVVVMPFNWQNEFLPSDPRPEVKALVEKYKAKYNEDPCDKPQGIERKN